MYVYAYACAYLYVSACSCMYMVAYAWVFPYVSAGSCMRMRHYATVRRVYICMHIACICTCIHAYMYVCMRLPHVYVYVYGPYAYVQTHAWHSLMFVMASLDMITSTCMYMRACMHTCTGRAQPHVCIGQPRHDHIHVHVHARMHAYVYRSCTASCLYWPAST